MGQDASPKSGNPRFGSQERDTRPATTFVGNTYDLASLAALAAGALLLFMCLTCNMGFYCLPFASIILGVVGLAAAGKAIEPKRTQLWSWIGVVTGSLVILLFAVTIALYLGLVFLAAFASAGTG
jgi:hypothetical protein